MRPESPSIAAPKIRRDRSFMSKSITIKKAKHALQNLRKLTPANPKIDDDLEISIKEAIAFIAPDLIQMTKRGFTVKELSAGLAADGIDVKSSTLKRYLNDYLMASKKDSEKSDSGSNAGDSNDEKSESDGKPGNNREADSHSGPSKRKLTGAVENPNSAIGNPKVVSENPSLAEKMTGENSDTPTARSQQGVRERA